MNDQDDLDRAACDIFISNDFLQKYDDTFLSKIVKKKLDDGRTLLHLAVSTDNVTYIKKLIELGSDVNALSKRLNTPIHRCKSVEVAKLLVDAKADINLKNCNGQTALTNSFLSDNIKLCKFLLEKGADFDYLKEHERLPKTWTERDLMESMIFGDYFEEQRRPPDDADDN